MLMLLTGLAFLQNFSCRTLLFHQDVSFLPSAYNYKTKNGTVIHGAKLLLCKWAMLDLSGSYKLLSRRGWGRLCQAESVIAISGILIFKIKSMMLISLIHLMQRQILFSFLFFLQKIHRALNMTYEDVKRQRANTEKRFWLCFMNLVLNFNS